jgi:cytoskeletal protein CcmA (bactofilin family)
MLMDDLKLGKSPTVANSKSSDSKLRPSSPQEPTRNDAKANEVRPHMPTAIIGSKIRIRGELIGDEDLTVQGYIEGTIDLKENCLTIGKEGTLKADVSAKTITVEGQVEGDLYGEDRVVISETSVVQGNIVAERLKIEEGARFRGSIDMDGDSREAFAKKHRARVAQSGKELNPTESAKEKLKKVVANSNVSTPISADKSNARFALKDEAKGPKKE